MHHLLFGKEPFLKREFIQALRGRLFSKESGFGNFQEFTSKKDALNGVFDFLLTAPFLSEKRLAVLWAVDDLSKEDQAALLSFLDKKISTAELILESEQSSVKKNSFLTALAGKCRQTPCYTPFDRDFPRWIQARAEKRQKQIENEAIELLLDRVGKDLASLDLALEQLAVFVAAKPRIALKDAETLLGKSIQSDVFQLLDFILEGDTAGALGLLSSLGKEGGKTYEVVGALVGQLERLRKAAALLEQGRSAQDIGLALKIHPFYLEKSIHQARQVSLKKADEILRQLLSCDESIKSGSLKDERAMERFLLEVC